MPARVVQAQKKLSVNLRSLLEIDDFYSTAVFIDPKDRQSEENKVRLDTFIKKLKEND